MRGIILKFSSDEKRKTVGFVQKEEITNIYITGYYYAP